MCRVLRLENHSISLLALPTVAVHLCRNARLPCATTLCQYKGKMQPKYSAARSFLCHIMNTGEANNTTVPNALRGMYSCAECLP